MTDHAQTTRSLNGMIVTADAMLDGGSMLTGPMGVKEIGLSEYARQYLSGGDVIAGDAVAGPSNPFRQVSWIYAFISAIATAASRVPIRLSRGQAEGTRSVWGFRGVRQGLPSARKQQRGKDAYWKAVIGEIVAGGDLFELLRKPNGFQRWNEFLEVTLGQLYNSGRVHWVFDEMVGRRPKSMVCISGKATRPKVDKSGVVPRLEGWEITTPSGGRHTILLEECITFQLFNPDNPHEGMSPQVPASLAIVSHYNADLYNAAMFGNSCEPGGVLRTEAPFDALQNEQIRTTFQQRHGGAINARRLAVLWGGMTYEPTASTMVEMQYAEGLRMRREDMSVVYGVPLAVLGILGRTGDSVAFVEAEHVRFWHNTITPLLEKIADAITDNLAPLFTGNLEAWADVEDMPVFRKLRLAQTETVEKYYRMGVPMADLNDWANLGLPVRDHYETAFIATTVQTLDQAQAGFSLPPLDEGPEQEPEPEPAGKTKRLATIDKAVAAQIWKRWQASWSPLARKCEHILNSHRAAQGRKLLKLLKAYMPAERGLNVKDDHPVIARVLVDVFDDAEGRQAFTTRMYRIAKDAGELGIRQALAEAGMAGAELTQTAQKLIVDRRIVDAIRSDAVRISTQIDSSTRRAIRASLNAGLDAGEGVRGLADRVSEYVSGSRSKSLGIARNAVAETLSMARREGRVAGHITHEIWLHSRGPGERRPGHVAAEATYASAPKPIADLFIVNGVSLRYPRDPAAPIGERANCQCVAIGKRLSNSGNDDGKAITGLLARGFYTYKTMLHDRTTEAAGTNNEGEVDNGES